MTDIKTIIENFKSSLKETSSKLISESLTQKFNGLVELDDLLVENRVEFIKNQFRDSMDFSHDELGKIKKSDELVDHIASKVDPTVNKAHTQWVTGQYKRGKIRQEDFPRVKKALKGFELTKQNLATKDINQFKTVADLEDHVATQKHRTIKDKDAADTVKGEDTSLQKVYSSEHGTGFKIPSRKASIEHYGPNGKTTPTRWCTAANSQNNMFGHYPGGKYTFHTPNNDVLQFHHQSGQIMDKNDVHVNLASDPRFAPHAEGIKEFIRQTGKSEKAEDSALMKTAGRSTAEVHASEASFEKSMSQTSNYASNAHVDSLKSASHTPEHFQKMMNWANGHGLTKGSSYDGHMEIQHAMAENPNTPADVVNHLFKTHHDHINDKSNGNTVRENRESRNIVDRLVTHPNLSTENREKIKDREQFPSRRDLSDDEITHVIKHNDPDQVSHLIANHNLTLKPEHQSMIQASGSGEQRMKLVQRPDAHESIVDDHIETALKVNQQMPHGLIQKASPAAVEKHADYMPHDGVLHSYNRDDIPSHVIEKFVTSGKMSAGDIKPKHASLAIASGKYAPNQQLKMSGISHQQADSAATETLQSDDPGKAYEKISAVSHPKVSNSVKSALIHSVLATRKPHTNFEKEDIHAMHPDHLGIIAASGNHVEKQHVATAKNVQKPHFDELHKTPALHGAIVASKSAPPSILTKLASSPSDYIRSKVKKHPNTPPDVKAGIEFDENKV